VISYHPSHPNSDQPDRYSYGFKTTEYDSIHELAEYASRYAWSPIIWTNGTRVSGSFRFSKTFALDFDNGILTIVDAVARLRRLGVAYLVGTTKSHQRPKKTKAGKIAPPCDRFRLVVPWAEAVTDPWQYRYNMLSAMRQLPADDSCKDTARFFWPCVEVVACEDGEAMRPMPLPADFHEQRAKQNARREDSIRGHLMAGTMPLALRHALEHGVGEGGRHKMVYRIGATLALLSYPKEKIVDLCMSGPLADIGFADVVRAVENGMERALRDAGER